MLEFYRETVLEMSTKTFSQRRHYFLTNNEETRGVYYVYNAKCVGKILHWLIILSETDNKQRVAGRRINTTEPNKWMEKIYII